MGGIGIEQLELALQISGTDIRIDLDAPVASLDALLLRAGTIARIADDPEQSRLALLGLDVLFKMVITRMAGESDRSYREVYDEMLTHARMVLEKAREFDLS